MAAANTKPTNTSVMSPVATASYVQLSAPKLDQYGNSKYAVSLIFPKSTDLKALKAAAEAAGKAKFGDKWETTRKKTNFRWPFRDGDLDKPEDEAYKNSIFMNTSTTKPIGACDAGNNPTGKPQNIDISEIYAGCKVRAHLNVSAYQKDGGIGVGVYINAIQKVADGEPLGMMAVNPENVFEAIEIPDDEMPF